MEGPCLPAGQQLSQSGHVGPQAPEARSSDASQEARNQGFYVSLSIVKPWLHAVGVFCFLSPHCRLCGTRLRAGLGHWPPSCPLLWGVGEFVSSWPRPQILALGAGCSPGCPAPLPAPCPPLPVASPNTGQRHLCLGLHYTPSTGLLGVDGSYRSLQLASGGS